MRLICPNCDAEYEVDDGAIPLTGRDVQCSNCGHAWFQQHPAGATAAAPAAPALPGEDAAAAAAPGAVETWAAAPSPEDPPLPSSRLDAAALALLKEEAARELAARRAAAPAPIEVQGDLGLPAPSPSPAPPAAPSSAPVAAPGPTLSAPPAAWAATVAANPAPPETTSRRSRLPDIEEINSTLRPQDMLSGKDSGPAADEDDDDAAAQSGSGSFRAGFLLVIALAVVLTVVYAMAPQIAQAVPALDDALAAYVKTVDGLRLWLDGALRGLIESLRGLAEPAA
jgi:predicted Zn finger-like uncharacterized protein